MTVEADALIRLVWRELAEAVVDPRHPWRTPVFVTGGPRSDGRVVVLRRYRAEPRQLTCFTDVRSPKVTALRSDPWVTWVFYHPELRLQVRVRGRASVHHDDAVTRADWEALPESGRREYATVAPPGSRDVGVQFLELSEAARNFAVVVTDAQEWDCLQLSTDGHRRVGLSAQGLERLVP